MLKQLNKLIDRYAEKCEKCENVECRKAEEQLINQLWTMTETSIRDKI